MLHIRFGALILTAIALMLTPASAEKRVALVVGNTHYEHSPALTNPANDAEDVARVLKSLGFEVLLGLDLDKRAFDLKVRDFALALSQADTALFFYAGHGLQVSLQNYLVPVDAKIARERDLDFEVVRLDSRRRWPARWARAPSASAAAWPRFKPVSARSLRIRPSPAMWPRMVPGETRPLRRR
jgi:hypothetical protein